MTTPCCSTGNGDWTLRGVAHFLTPLRGLVVLAVSVIPSVVSSRSSHMPLRGLVVLVVSVTPSVVSSLSSHTPLRGLVVLVGFGGHSAGHG